MNKLYLITGATGHVGTVLTGMLAERRENVRVLVRGDVAAQFPDGVNVCRGDIRDRDSLLPFFRRDGYDCVTNKPSHARELQS